MAITSLKQLRETAPPEFQSLDDRELIARYSQSAGVPFEQAASYFGVPARGLGREMLTQAAGGAMVDLPRMVGQAAEYLGAEEFGQSLQAGARAREAAYTPDVRGRNVVGEALVLGSRALAPVAATLPLGLVPGGQFVAPAAAAGLFGLSSAQETYQKLIEQGVPEAEAAAAARGTGLIQGAGEAAATYAGARLFKPAMAAVRGAPTTARIAAEATETGVARPFLKGMGVNLAVQPTTEVAQDVGSALVEEAYGAKPEDKLEIARQSALGGAGLTLLLGPLAMGGSIQRSRNAARLKEALDPASNVDPTFRYAAMDRIMEEARRQGVAESDVGMWLDTQLQAEDSLTAELQAQEQEAFRQRVLQRIEAGEPPEIAEASTAQEAQNPEFWRAFEQRVGIAPEGPAPVGLRREQAQEGFDLLRGPRVPGTTEVMPGVYLETPEQPAPQAQPIDLTQPTTTTISQAQLAEEEGGPAPEMLAAQPSAVSVSGVNAPTLPVPPMQEQLAEEELPAQPAPGTIATQPIAESAASLPGQGTGLPPTATPVGGLSPQQQAARDYLAAIDGGQPVEAKKAKEVATSLGIEFAPKARIATVVNKIRQAVAPQAQAAAKVAKPAAPTAKVTQGAQPAGKPAELPANASEAIKEDKFIEDTLAAIEKEDKTPDAPNLLAEVRGTKASVPGKPSFPAQVYAAIRNAVLNPDQAVVVRKPKSVEIDAEATATYGEQVRRIAMAVRNFASAYDAYLSQNVVRSNAVVKRGETAEAKVEPQAQAIEVAAVNARNALAALGEAVNNNPKDVEAIVRFVKDRVQSKARTPATEKLDVTLSSGWTAAKRNVFREGTDLLATSSEETRRSRESQDKTTAADPQLVAAATQGAAPFGKGAKETQLRGILNYIRQIGTPYEKSLAQAIKLALGKSNVTIAFSATNTPGFTPKANTITIRPTESREVALHEALHSALQWFVYTNPKLPQVEGLKAALKKVLEYDTAKLPPKAAEVQAVLAQTLKGKNELDAVLELISYGTTLNDFRRALEQMPRATPRTFSKFANDVLDMIYALVRRFFGGRESLATEVMDHTFQLLEGARAAREATPTTEGGKLQAAVQTGTYSPESGNILEAAVTSNTATREAAGITLRDYRTYQKRLAPSALSSKIAFDALGWGKAAAFTTEKLDQLAKMIRKDLPMVERALIYIDSTFSASPRARQYLKQTKFDRNVGYQQMEELAKHFELVDADGKMGILSYLDGDKKALRGRDDEAYLRSIADDVRKWLDTYIDTLPDSEKKFFRTGKFSETLLFPETTEQVASSTFGTHKLSELMGTKRKSHETIDSFREWMQRPDGTINVDTGRFYEVTQHSDLTKGPIHAGYISVENYNANGAPKGFAVDTQHKWWITSYSGEKHNFAASMTAKDALKEQKGEKVSNALRNTMAALANNYAAQNFSKAMSQLGYENGKPTAEAVVFDNIDAINETFGVKIDPKHVLSVSSNEARSSQLRSEYRRTGTWVKLPESANYGELAGKYIHGPVWTAMIDATDRQPLVQSRAYNNTMRWFKKSKTVFNPATHVTNVASNITLAMLHDIPMRTMGKAAALFAKYAANPKLLTQNELELMSAFRNSGAMLGDFSSSEVKQALYDAWKANMDADNDSSLIRRLKSFTKYEQLKSMGLSKIIEKGKAGAEVADRIASEAYAAEDNIFRLAAFLTKAGDLQVMRGESSASEQTILDAGAFAKMAFLDYDIDSKAVKIARQSVMPFISWTYAVTPVLGRIALHQPWKIANVLLAYYLMERGLAAMSGDDDEEAREGGPEYVRERMWGFGPYMHMRIPFLGDDENPVYYRVGDYVPMATMFKSLPNGPMGQSWWPASLTPSGPFVSAIIGLVAGVDPYTGKGINEATDTDLQKLWNATKFMYDTAMPPVVNSRNLDRARAVVEGDMGITGAMPSGYQFVRMAGLKLYDYNVPEEQARQELAVKRIERDFKTAMSKAKREEMRKGTPDWEALDEEIATLERRMEEEVAKARGGELE